MLLEQTFLVSLQRIVSILEELDFEYHLTGGVVSMIYGEPRYTQDIDFVLKLGEQDVPRLTERCASAYLFSEEVIYEAVKGRRLFQFLDDETLVKIDFHVGEAVPGEIQRATRKELIPGLSVRIVSKEDAILSKLLWVKQGSGKSRQDIRSMYKNSEAFNRVEVENMAKDSGVAELLNEVLAEKI